LTRKKIGKPAREFTRRQLSHRQQQKKRQRIIAAAGIFIIASVLVLVGAGWYITQYRPLHQTVITVNDTKFDMNYYIKMLKFYGEGQSIYYLTDEVVRIIEQNELVRQEVEGKLGISVSNDAVDEELKSRNPPLSKDYRDVVRAQMLVTKLRDGYFEQKVPIFAEHRHIMAMFLEDESRATEVRARLEDGEDFAELAGELSLDDDSKNKKGNFGWQTKDVLTILLGSPVLGEHAFSAEVGALSQPIYDEAKTKSVGYWLVEVLDRDEETGEAYVQAILLGSEGEVLEVRAKLEAGEDFATLAKELSQLPGAKEDAGYLGLLAPDMTTPAFNEAVFGTKLEPGTLSEPVRDEDMITKGGYWLVKVLEKADDKRIEDADRDLLKTKALSDWASALWDDPENAVESYLDDEKKAWAVERALGSQN